MSYCKFRAFRLHDISNRLRSCAWRNSFVAVHPTKPLTHRTALVRHASGAGGITRTIPLCPGRTELGSNLMKSDVSRRLTRTDFCNRHIASLSVLDTHIKQQEHFVYPSSKSFSRSIWKWNGDRGNGGLGGRSGNGDGEASSGDGSGGEDGSPSSGDGAGDGGDYPPPSMVSLSPMTIPEDFSPVPLIAVPRNPVFPKFIKIIEVGTNILSCLYLVWYLPEDVCLNCVIIIIYLFLPLLWYIQLYEKTV